MIILEPWAEDFSWATLLPVGAAFFWACYSLMVKKLSSDDSPSTMVVYLLLLITPFNILLAAPEWQMPSGFNIWAILIVIGVLTALAQWAIVKAYSVADASFVQPFDHAKLPLNVLAGWIVFSWVPPGRPLAWCRDHHRFSCFHHPLGNQERAIRLLRSCKML